jgi:hypothetical protein
MTSLLLRFLRLFPHFRELEALAEMRLRQTDETEQMCVRAEARIGELAAENCGLVDDLTACRLSHAELTTEKLLLQDRLDSAIADKDHLWAMVKESMNGERYALKSQVNHAIQRSSGGIPYPEAHSMPENAVPQVQEPGPVGRRARELPSQAVARHDRQMIEEMVGRMANRS